jgi:hypothetical protein
VEKSDLRPGAILLLEDTLDTHTATHGLIKLGQLSKGASRKYVHALIWVQEPKNVGAEKEIAEASGSGLVRCSGLKGGTYAAFVPKDANLGDWAAQVAMMWAVDGKITYGRMKAGGSLLHSSDFGENAKRRARAYANVAFENPPAGGQGDVANMFCSEFVIAVYQAAQFHTKSKTQIKLDAKHSTPARLKDWLTFSADFRQQQLVVPHG